jgi:hypothetical protein
VRCSALSPLRLDALRGSRGVEAKVAKQPGFLCLQRLYLTLCRAPLRFGALRCSPSVEAKVAKQPGFLNLTGLFPTECYEPLRPFLWVTFLWASKEK